MIRLALIAVGGSIGALSRYGLGGLAQRLAGASFPLGTFAVNMAGCFLIGSFMCLMEERQMFGSQTRLFFVVGFCGSFTTLSAVGYETFALLRSGQAGLALLNAAGNMGLGVLSVIAGWMAARAI